MKQIVRNKFANIQVLVKPSILKLENVIVRKVQHCLGIEEMRVRSLCLFAHVYVIQIEVQKLGIILGYCFMYMYVKSKYYAIKQCTIYAYCAVFM